MIRIYEVLCLDNGKRYIGKTSRTIEERWSEHVRDSERLDLYFYRAIKSHGPDAFEVKQIDYTESEQEANELERLYIGIFQSHRSDKGYNSTFGGEGGRQTDEVRQKMSRNIREALADPNTSKKHSESISGEKNHRFGKKNSADTREKISKALTGRKLSPEQVDAIREGQRGRKHSPETIEKIRRSRYALWANPEYAEKQRISHLKQ